MSVPTTECTRQGPIEEINLTIRHVLRRRKSMREMNQFREMGRGSKRGNPKNMLVFFAYSCSVQYHDNLAQHRLEILFLLDQAFAVTKLNPFEGNDISISKQKMVQGRYDPKKSRIINLIF